jgi:hypothetical protein
MGLPMSAKAFSSIRRKSIRSLFDRRDPNTLPSRTLINEVIAVITLVSDNVIIFRVPVSISQRYSFYCYGRVFVMDRIQNTYNPYCKWTV